MADFEKGAQVRIVSGKGKGVTGEVFWWGKSKFGDGMRAGVAGADGEKYWVDAEDLAHWDPDAPQDDSTPTVATGKHLEGLKVVLTGEFDSYERSDAHAILEKLGADVTSSVSGKTMLLIVGRDPGSKVQKAKQKGIPQIDEAQMLAMIAGKTLEEVLADAPVAVVEEKPVVDMPFAPVAARTRTIETKYEGSEQVHIAGEMVDGLRTGSWKEYWPNGQIKQDYHWERGLKHGQEFDWTEGGVQECDGQNERHVRTGTWTWWHNNGEYMHAYTYDAEGKAHGDYVWNLEDGQPRARGEFWHGDKHGDWEWHHEPNHERVTRQFWRGRKHGEDAAWYVGGQLAYRDHYFNAYQHGDFESYYPDGSPKFRGTYHYGVPVGEHHAWDGDGNETVTTFVDGLSEVPSEKVIARLVKKLGKAKDNYAKEDAFDVVDWGERSSLAYHLWKAHGYDMPSDPDLWDLLTSNLCGLFSGEDVMTFLKTASTKGYGAHLPYWDYKLDRLVTQVYARDPEPIDAGWKSLPKKMRAGVALVRARFGKDIGDELKSEIGALAKKHATDYGIADRIHWPNEDGIIEEQKLFSDFRGTPTALFDTFIGWFGGRDAWVEALEPYAMEEADQSVSRVSFVHFRPLIESANVDLMIKLCEGISLDNQTHELLWDALWSWREDDGATMAKIAIGVKETGLHKWPLVTAAVLKLKEEGKQIPAELVDAFEIDNESPTYSSQWMQLNEVPEEFRSSPHYVAAYRDMSIGCAVPRNQRVHDALRALTPTQLRSVFERYLKSDDAYQVCRLTPYLYLVNDPEVWAHVLEVAEGYQYGADARNSWGFANIGLRIVPMLEGAMGRATSQKAKCGWAQAIVCALCRAAVDGEEIPEKYDEHVRFDVFSKSDDHYYTYFRPFMDRLVYELPQDRAEKILLRGLDSPFFWRAITAVPAHPTEAVLAKVFAHVMEVESTMNYEQNQAFGQALKGLENARDWVKWILQSGGGGGCKDALTAGIGWPEFEAVEKELAESGIEKPRELDAIDRFVALAEKSSTGDTIYALRRTDAVDDTLNIIGGAAPGVGEDRWPHMDDEPMAHLYTLDLKTMPLLAQRYPDARTISVFCFQPDYNEAWEAYNEWTAVVFSTQEQVDTDVDAPEEIDPSPEAGFEVVTVEADFDDKEIRTAIYRLPARVLGYEMWLQEPDDGGAFIMQFDERFSYMNLGDSGIMYVFDDTAYWQCH